MPTAAEIRAELERRKKAAPPPAAPTGNRPDPEAIKAELARRGVASQPSFFQRQGQRMVSMGTQQPAAPSAPNPNAPNPITTAMRQSTAQVNSQFAAQKAEEERRRQERREASRVNMGDFVLTDNGQGNIAPDLTVERDIGKGVLASPITFGQGLAEGGANIVNNVTNIGAEGINAANRMLLGDRAYQFRGTDIQVPQNVIVDGDGPLASNTGMIPRFAGQYMAGRVPLGKLAPGKTAGQEIAKGALAFAGTTDKDTPRLADMFPEGTPGIDLLQSKPGDSYTDAFAKNLVEDLTLSGVAEGVIRGGGALLNNVGQPQRALTPGNAGGANLGPVRPQPSVAAVAPPAVPQGPPRMAQAGPAGAGQQPAGGPATLQATPRNVAPAVSREEIAVARDTAKAVSRFMRGARVPGHIVNDYVGSLLSRYEPLKSDRYPLAFFIEEDLPQYLQSRGYSPAEARNLAGDVAAKTDGWGQAAHSFNASGNSSRYTMQDTIHQLTTTQKDELEGTFKAVLGDETLAGKSDDIVDLMQRNGQEAYNNSLSEANRLLRSQKATPEQAGAVAEMVMLMKTPAYRELVPESWAIEATTTGRSLDDLIDAKIADDPIGTAHLLQSEIGEVARGAKNIDGTPNKASSAYETRRKALLDRLEKFNGYKGARQQHGDLYGAKDSVTFGDRFLSVAKSEFATEQMARDLAKLSPRQQQVAALSIRDALLNPLLRTSPEDASARITQLQNEGTLKALVTVLGPERGNELRNAIANMRVENQRIARVNQNAGSPTNLKQQGGKDAIDNIRGPINRTVHGVGNPGGWAMAVGADLAFGTGGAITATKAAGSLVDKLSTPGRRFQSRVTKGLYGLPARQADDALPALDAPDVPPAGQIDAPPATGAPVRKTKGPPKPRAPRPPVTPDEWQKRIQADQDELQRLLRAYDEIDRTAPDVDDLMRANLHKQSLARRRIADKTKKLEAARNAPVPAEAAAPATTAPRRPPEQAGFVTPGALAPLVGGSGGLAYGEFAPLQDMDRDGDTDADDRQAMRMSYGLGGLVTGLVAGAGANRLLGPRRGAPKAGPARRFRAPDQQTFAGVNAKTADKVALARAQNMEAEGASRDAIWDETGWFKGVDGKWRFEIDDSGAKLTGNKSGRLGSVMDHPELFKAYPDMASTQTQISGRGGDYIAPGRYSDEIIRAGDPDARSVLLHEAGGHGVQQREGFARGGSPTHLGDVLPGSSANQKQMIYDEAKRQYDELAASSALRGGQAPPPFHAAPKETRDEMFLRARYNLYGRIAGEVEANNVQTRDAMRMRGEKPGRPWETQDVPDDQQIVRFGSGKAESRAAPKAGPQKPPAQSGFGGAPTKGPPRPLMSGKVISELERAKKTLPPQVRSQIAANAAKPSTLRVSAAEATGDDPSLYTLAAPFQRTRNGIPGRKPKPNAIEAGVRDTMARIDASTGKPPPLDEAGEAMRLSERQRRAAKSAAQTTANKLNPYVNEAAGIPDKPLPKSVAAREQEATELAITARKLLEKHRLTANEYEQAVAQANARKAEIADALVTGRIAPPNQKGLLPGSAGQTVPPRQMKPVSRRDAEEMAELLFNRENAEMLDAVLSGRVTPRNRDRYHAALLFAAGGTAGAAGIAAVLADIEAAAQRRRDDVAAKKPKPVYDDPGDPRFVWDWDKIKSTRNKHMEDIQIKLNELPPNASGGKFNLKPDGIWRENGATDRAIRKWLYDNGFDPNEKFTMEHWDILTEQFQEAQQKRGSTRAAPYRGSLGEMTTP